MKKNEKQSGNVLGILLIAIAVGVVGVLGLVFWRNSMAQKDQNPTNSMSHDMDGMENMDMSH